MRTDRSWLHSNAGWLVLIVGLFVTFLLVAWARAQVELAAMRRFAYASDQIAVKVSDRLAKQEALLYGGAALLTVAEPVTRDVWHRYWQETKTPELLPGLQGFGFAQLVRPEALQAHIEQIRAEGFADYNVFPAGPREVYSAIVYLEPFVDRNLRAFGYDMFSEPVRREAMERALVTGRAALTGPVRLVQEDGQDPQVGVLMYAPTYRQGMPLNTEAERRAAMLGWSYSPYRMNDLVEGMLGDWDAQLGVEIVLSVYDGTDVSEANLLYTSAPPTARESNPLFAQQRQISFNGRTWLLTFNVPSARGAVDYTTLWWMLGGGLLATCLSFLLVRGLQNRQQLANELAEKLTADIRRQGQKLREDEFRWDFALDGSGIGVWDTDLKTNQVFFSARSKALLGCSDENPGGYFEAWVQCLHPEDKDRVLRERQGILGGHSDGFDTTYRIQTKAGSDKWLRDRGAVVARSESGQALRMIGTFSDVSEQIQSLARVQQLARLNAVMSECNAAIIHCTTQEALFERITRVVVECGHLSMCWIGLADPQTGLIHPAHAFGQGTEYLEGIDISLRADEPRGRGPVGTALRENRPVWIEDFSTDPRAAPWSERAARYGWRSAVGLPISRAGQAFAVLMLYEVQAGWYDPETRLLLEALAEQISFAVDKFDAEARVLAQQKREQQAREQLQQVLEAMPVPIQIYPLTQRRLNYINQAHRQWLGYELDEIATWAQWFKALYLAEEGQARQQRWENTITQMQQGQPIEMPETTLRSKRGEIQVGRARATLVGDEIVLVWTDLTEIRRQEAELKESERRFRSMVENAVTGMYVRRDRKLIYVNNSFCQMLGRSADELLGSELTDFSDLTPQDWERIFQAWEKLNTGARNVPLEATLLHNDGTRIEVGIRLNPIEWDDGQPAVIGLVDDITMRKRAAAQIDNYVQRLEASMQATLRAVATMVELRDPYTAGHERRVGLIAAAIAQELGWSADRCKNMETIGLVHDIGKVAVPAEILSKPALLTSIEMQLVQEHAQAGYDILKDVPFDFPVAETIRQHHERMDGSGYPRGLKGEDILPEARVLAVADVLESMAAHRPYRPALSLDVALQELEQGRARLYDGETVDATVRLIRDKGYVLPS